MNSCAAQMKCYVAKMARNEEPNAKEGKNGTTSVEFYYGN
jgi:hypothetical protein